MRLHGAHAHEQLGGDLLVGPPGGRELRHARLGLCELVPFGSPAADPRQLRPRLLRPQPRAELPEDRKCLLQRVACRLLLLSLAADHAQAEQRAAPLEHIRGPVQFDERRLKGVKRGRNVTLRRGQLATAAGSAGSGPSALDPPRILLVRVEVDACLLDLAQGDERLDRVGPDRLRGIVQPRADESRRQLGEISARFLNVPERQLQTAEHAEAQQAEHLVLRPLHLRQALLGRGPRLVHETEIRLDQGLYAALPTAVVCEPHLLAKAASLAGELERKLPVPAKPLENAPVPQDVGARLLVPPRHRLVLQNREHRSRLLEPALADAKPR